MPTPTRKCLHCRKTIRRKSSKVKFCGKTCSNAHRAVKKLKNRVDGFASTSFGKWLLGALKQAGTVAALTGVNIEELYSLWKQCREYNGYGHDLPRTELYQLSHIAPANGVGIVGLLHPRNLVIAPAQYNNARQTKWDGVSGKYIERFEASPALAINKGDDSAVIIKKIRKVCPSFDRFLSNEKLSLLASVSLARKLKKDGCTIAHEGMQYQDLKNLELGFYGHEPEGGGRRSRTPDSLVFHYECWRLGAAEPEDRVVDWDYLHGRHDVWFVLKRFYPEQRTFRESSPFWEAGEDVTPAGWYDIKVRSSEYDPEQFSDCQWPLSGGSDSCGLVPMETF